MSELRREDAEEQLSARKLRRIPDDASTDAEFWERRGRETMSQPSYWFVKAAQLRRAAEALWQHIHAVEPHVEQRADAALRRTFDRRSTRPVYMLLAGFALENVAKALIVERESERVRREGVLPWARNGHDLPQLFADAGVALSDVEADLVRRLETFVRWSGRYPMARRPADFRSEWLQDDPTEPGTYVYATGDDDHELFLRIFRRLAPEMDA